LSVAPAGDQPNPDEASDRPKDAAPCGNDPIRRQSHAVRRAAIHPRFEDGRPSPASIRTEQPRAPGGSDICLEGTVIGRIIIENSLNHVPLDFVC